MRSRPPTRRGRSAGFTMIELLMAATASTLILLALYGVFGRAMKLRDNATERVRVARLRSRAVAVIRNDLRNALISGGTLAASLQGSPVAPGSRFPGYLKFTTTTGAQDEAGGEQPSGDVQQVEYFIANDPGAGGREAGTLVRTVDRALLAPLRETPREQPILSGVASLEVSFYDGQTWANSWEVTDDDKSLPQAVRVRVVPAADEKNPAPLPLEILVPWTTQAAVSADDAAAATSPTPPDPAPTPTPNPSPTPPGPPPPEEPR